MLAPCVLTLLSIGTTFIIIGSLFTITSAVKNVFGPKTAEVTYKDEEICVMMSFVIYIRPCLLRSRVLIPLVTVIFCLFIYSFIYLFLGYLATLSVSYAILDSVECKID